VLDAAEEEPNGAVLDVAEEDEPDGAVARLGPLATDASGWPEAARPELPPHAAITNAAP
jgi:hypothetical protein